MPTSVSMILSSSKDKATSLGDKNAAPDTDGMMGSTNDETENNNSTKAKKKKSRKIRPKLKPISSFQDGMDDRTSPGRDDDLGFGNFVSASSTIRDVADNAATDEPSNNRTNTNPSTTPSPSSSVTTTPPPKTRLKPRLTNKIQPRSSLFSPEDVPRTPDDYDAFGFDLVKTNSSSMEDNTKNEESVEEALKNNSSDTTPGGSTTSTKQFSSPLSLRKVMSSDSYISDDSSTSAEDIDDFLHTPYRPIKRDFMKEEDELEHIFAVQDGKRKKREDDGVVNNTTAHSSPRRALLFHRQTSTSVSITASALEDSYGGQSGGTAVHMINSYRGIRNDASFSSSSSDDSSLGSYFSAHRACLPQSHHHTQQQPLPVSNPHSHNNPNPHQNIQGLVPLSSQLLTPPSPMRTISAPHPPSVAADNIIGARNVIELKLSLSEEESASERILRADDSLTEGSTDSEGGEHVGGRRSGKGSPFRQTSTTPFSQGSMSSVDDQVIKNELSAYSLSNKLLRRSSGESGSLSGRHAPVEGHHASSVLTPSNMDTPPPVSNFYANPQSAMLAASSAQSTAKPHAHHDSPFLTNLRGGFKVVGGSVASEGSFISSPRGAFGEPEHEPEAEIMRSPHDISVKTPSTEPEPEAEIMRSPHDISVKTSITIQSHSHQPSLAYSDDGLHALYSCSEEDNEGRRSGRGSKSCLGSCNDVDDDEEAMTIKNLLNERDQANLYSSSRWIMLSYMVLLNLLGGWTGFSLAPIPNLAAKTLDVDPESLVTLFLAANVVGSVIEPAILGWFGLRKTILLGALLLMAGNMVKSGVTDTDDQLDLRMYVGFILAGLSQPLYQCTPALLSAIWFPREERSLATGIALYSNQLGIGCAFVFATLLVRESDDLLPYFHSLSILSLVVFVGIAMQFDDCPPTPPSGTARIIRGTVERPIFTNESSCYDRIPPLKFRREGSSKEYRNPTLQQRKYWQRGTGNGPSNSSPFIPLSTSFENAGMMAEYNTIAQAPSPVFDGPTELAMEHIDALAHAPSPMMSGPVAGGAVDSIPSYGSTDTTLAGSHFANNPNNVKLTPSERADDVSAVSSPFPNLRGEDVPSETTYYSYKFGQQFQPKDHLPPTDEDGAEPIMVQTPGQLDIAIHYHQFWLSLRACFARKGFSHCALAFATSSIAINTLSTFMWYLVESVGIIGGAFQLLIILSSITCRSCCTEKAGRLYYMIILALALGALALALCGANLDSGESLWLNLMMVAVFVGPLQPLSTELGVDVADRLSENTVWVIQQFFSNLLSAACIPVFKALRDASALRLPMFKTLDSAPDFTYSFYLLVMIHALATIYFASFSAQYLRHEDPEEEERRKEGNERTPPLDREIGVAIYQTPK